MNKENMGYKSSINSNDLRSELMGKVSLEGFKEETREVEVNLVDTLALNDLIQKINASNVTDSDRRSELLDKFGNTQSNSLEEEKETPKFEEKETVDVDSLIDDRSEINGKFDNNEKSKEHSAENKERRKNIEIKLEDTIALDNVIEDVSNIKLSEEDKRTELNGMFNNNKKVKVEEKKEEVIKEEINAKVEEEILEDKEDKIQEATETISLAMVILIVVSCLVVGSIVGYMLYRIALNG